MTVSAQRLARVFVEVADTLVAEFDVIEFMQMLADRAAGLVDASAVGLLLADQHGRLQFIAASDENTRLLELFQSQGMVMVQLGVSLAEALTRIRAYAYAEDRRLTDVAADIVARRLRFDRDPT